MTPARHLDHSTLSSTVPEPGQNPYTALINTCHDNPDEIQALYAAHRSRRNAQQRDKFLADPFTGLSIDQTLLRLEREPGFADERNCLVFWARLPEHVVRLAAMVQQRVVSAAEGIWLMPTHRMHMTTLEVAFSKTPEEIEALISGLRHALPAITSYTYGHRATLVRPMLSYDTSAFALSYLPAAAAAADGSPDAAAAYTYHHLRRDLFDCVRLAGVQVASRYQVPSAHVTLGRFLDADGLDALHTREAWIRAVDDVNAWLEKEVWGEPGGGGEWVVGQEKGLDARAGTLWYGGGRTVLMGEGF